MRFEQALRPAPIDHVAIIGCGFSGALQAINLVRHEGPRATIIERRAEAGKGVAYSSLHPQHVLNVRAAKMSALPDEPDHFVAWLKRSGQPFRASDFVPRQVYGTYLQELLGDAVGRSAGRLKLVRADVDALRYDGSAEVRLSDGSSFTADRAVLAVGNLPPHDPDGFRSTALSQHLYQTDPWAFGALEQLDPLGDVLLLGTGLTMVDVCLLLKATGHRGTIHAVSRRGLVPHRHHEPHAPPPRRSENPRGSLAEMTRDVRARAREIDWQDAVDELRPMTQPLWRGLTTGQRARFLRHLRPWWDIHRHRIAPAVSDVIAGMRASGQLNIIAGKTVDVSEEGGKARVLVRPRHQSNAIALAVGRVVNCTGPQGDLLRTSEPLLRQLIADGLIAPDALRIGIDVDPQSRTVRADGGVNHWLYAIGPLTRGAFWEIVAVPDIRAQSWNVARQFSNAHWVGGEGL